MGLVRGLGYYFLMRYQVVIFDLDGTLRESEPHFMDALRGCLADYGITVDGFEWRLTERWVHRYWAQSPELLQDVAEVGDEGVWTRFICRLMEHAGHMADWEEAEKFAAYVREQYQPRSRVKAGVCETLEALKERVQMGVLSNRMNSFDAELAELGIDGYFDFTVAAGEVGIWKPQPGIFRAALARAGGVSPEEALYVGDNYYADIVGANEAGLDAILLDDRHVFTDVMCTRVERMDEVLLLLDGKRAGSPRHR
ncbi:MAG: HAD family hydrolase [Caldilineae bacterium]|nr:MAG: HAD family hydrolase [Caldilineae bacterium]